LSEVDQKGQDGVHLATSFDLPRWLDRLTEVGLYREALGRLPLFDRGHGISELLNQRPKRIAIDLRRGHPIRLIGAFPVANLATPSIAESLNHLCPQVLKAGPDLDHDGAAVDADDQMDGSVTVHRSCSPVDHSGARELTHEEADEAILIDPVDVVHDPDTSDVLQPAQLGRLSSKLVVECLDRLDPSHMDHPRHGLIDPSLDLSQSRLMLRPVGLQNLKILRRDRLGSSKTLAESIHLGCGEGHHRDIFSDRSALSPAFGLKPGRCRQPSCHDHGLRHGRGWLASGQLAGGREGAPGGTFGSDETDAGAMTVRSRTVHDAST
jgi:hypothetical protein